MPTIARHKRFRFFFFSNEGHEPPHIHVEAGGKYAKFWLSPVILARSAGFNASELGKLNRFIAERSETFKEKWNEYFGR